VPCADAAGALTQSGFPRAKWNTDHECTRRLYREGKFSVTADERDKITEGSADNTISQQTNLLRGGRNHDQAISNPYWMPVKTS
jgi:hypothetical protein